jgi:tetratricopeptide (TPR) repeat protein
MRRNKTLQNWIMMCFAMIGLLVGATRVSEAQSIDWLKVHELTLRGIDQLYGLEWEQAEKTFNDVIRMAPQDPRGYFFKAMIHYWDFNLTKNRKAFEEFFRLSEQVIAICDKELEKDSKNTLATFYLGGIYGFRGVIYQRDGSLWKAAWDGRKGYSLLKEATTIKPDLYDAQMGFGLFSYLVGKIPKSYRWILSVLGISGDVEGGLAALRLAAENGTYTRSEASFFLAQFLFFEREYDEAYRRLDYVMKKYPENPLFLITFAQWEFRQEKFESSMKAAHRAIEINNRKKIKYGDEFAYSILANCYFAQDDFENTRINVEAYLERVEDQSLVQNSMYYRLGIAYEIGGNREKAIASYKKMKKVVTGEGSPWNGFYFRRGQFRVQKPISTIDIELIRAENALDSKRYAAAHSTYAKIAWEGKASVDQKAEALYGLGQTYYRQERYQETVDIARQLIGIRVVQEKWLVPHGYFLLGQAYARLGLGADARRSFEAIDDYDDYDFQRRIESRRESELEKLAGVN